MPGMPGMPGGMPGGLPGMPGGMPGMPGTMPPGMLSGKGGMQASAGQTAPMGMGVPPGLVPPQAQPPRQAAPKASEGGNAAAAAAAAVAASPGHQQSQFEIPQAKVQLLIGKQSSTVNAVKTFTKATLFIEQHCPEEEKARVYVVGSATQCEKCKQTVLALLDGTMSLPTLFQLAGVPMPQGAKEHADSAMAAAASGSSMPRPEPAAASAAMGTMPPPMGYPGMGTLPPASMPPAMGTMPPNSSVPENQQMQQNLNDYYARMWSTYGKQQQQGSDKPAKKQEPAVAFDKDMLARLAEKAASGEAEPAVPPPAPKPPVAEPPRSLPAEPAYGLGERASDEVRALLGDSGAPPPPRPMETAPSGIPVPPPSSMPMMPGLDASSASTPAVSSGAQPGQMKNFTLKGFLRPGAGPGQEAQKPKKDDDSVHKMLERLQGNVAQSKQATSFSDPQHPSQQRLMQMMKSGQVFPGNEGMQYAQGPGRQEIMTQRDVEFEALKQRMQAIQSSEDVENVGREVLIRFPAFSPQQVSDLLQSLNSIEGLQQDEFLAELVRLLIARLRELNSSQFTTLTSTLASWTGDARRKRGGRFMELSRAYFSAASAEMSSRLMEFAPHEINSCLAAFVSVGFSEQRFFASVARAALARHTSFAPVQLTALLAILSEMRLVHADLFNAAANFLSARAKELRPVDIIRVLRSYAKCSVQNQGLCRAVADEVVNRVREKGTSFRVEDLCEIAWTLCVLQCYHEALFKLMFKTLEKSPMIATDALIMVYECHLVLETEFKEAYSRYAIDYDMVDILQDHYKENRKDERRCSERQRNDVASVLKSLVDGSVHVNHRTSTGLLVDVAGLRKRSSTDGFIHVDLDSAVTTVRPLDQDEPSSSALVVEGAVALRRNILQKNGLRLVTVRESEWRELGDSKEKRRYLRQLLSNAGDVLK
eukprot:TRINITY_DN194_c1_g2_i1.p1 TRINITY_DN194_c1_g2~~TRINITY_DN194_c1_g2_i1.p1  ORF type:complete len:933 (+),score=233.30 TRINITY_DN194_c1_g2_i1:2-2800(+)